LHGKPYFVKRFYSRLQTDHPHAGGHAGPDGQRGIKLRQQRRQAFKVMSHQRKAGYRGEVVVELFDDKGAHIVPA
jgi:hypothetical protein